MTDILLGLTLICAAGTAIMLVTLLRRQVAVDLRPLEGRIDAFDQGLEKVERSLRDELARNREEAQAASRQHREEVSGAVKDLREGVTQQLIGLSGIQHQRLEDFSSKLTALTAAIDTRMTQFAEGDQQRSELMRIMTEERLRQVQHENSTKLELIRTSTDQRLGQFQTVITASLETVRSVVDQRLIGIQEDNAKKLDQMRATVDEKLQGTLEKRLGESFKLVSDRLDLVHRGLGEMQSLANGVGDLKRVLTNVSTRGTWGELRLESILEQILSPDQYERNVSTGEKSTERVEFAIKFPGRGEAEGPLWVPIDSKFPKEDYERLVAAEEAADAEAVDEARKMLERSILISGRTICSKYVNPPNTTDFGIMFLPTEGLYAEVAKRPGLIEKLQQECRIMVAGPTNLAAFLNSLQMGFRTLAIQKRSSEVWEILGKVKKEFATYGKIIYEVKEKLDSASKAIEEKVGLRTRVINKALRKIEESPMIDQAPLLPLLVDGDSEDEGTLEDN